MTILRLEIYPVSKQTKLRYLSDDEGVNRHATRKNWE